MIRIKGGILYGKKILTEYMGIGSADAGRRCAGRLYRKRAGRHFRPELAGLWQQFRAVLPSCAGPGRTDPAVWPDHSLHHCRYHRHCAGVPDLQKNVMMTEGVPRALLSKGHRSLFSLYRPYQQACLYMPVFCSAKSIKSCIFSEKYSSFLEKKNKTRYDKM